MSEAPATPISPTSPGLCPKWRVIALQELGKLRGRERQKLSEYRVNAWSAGLLLAWLHLIEKRRKEVKLSIVELTGRFDVPRTSTVSNWFSKGEITATHFAQLIQQPEFADVRPSADAASFHAYRVAVTWVRREVLGFRTDRRLLGFDELVFLILGHCIDPDDPDVFLRLPEKLKTIYPKNDDVWFCATFQRWGRPYRLAVLQETEDED